MTREYPCSGCGEQTKFKKEALQKYFSKENATIFCDTCYAKRKM